MTTENQTSGGSPSGSAPCSRLAARAKIAEDLYREGKITRAECFRLGVDAAIGRDSGPIRYEDNDDHERMMTGAGEDHDEYRRREALYYQSENGRAEGAGAPAKRAKDEN